ncbi:MAG: glucans biosynthesis glucosyltransferase MdoH [Gammaproteobacteria bacterium]|nr:MAG: glucans biosynthesis glucosyltransferase MdoH [Gammaproteobacteria bacterium]
MDALRRSGSWMRPHVRLRRTLFFGLTLLTAGCASALLLDVLQADSLSGIELVGLLLFFALFAWIASAFWTAIAGFAISLVGGDPAAVQVGEVAGRPLRTRTAVAMPVYNEDPRRVAAGLEAIWCSLARESQRGAFDFFILSDTRDPGIAAEEEAMWQRFVARHRAAGRVFYRRRRDRSDHKAGNIADFVRRWGAGYDYMIVLDADSIMSGSALVTLARVMDAHPEIGILQSLPLPVGRETLFARLLQFGARLQSPMLASGLAFWQLGESNYWGHNAILRLQAFARHCTLPHLPGKPPLGGEILSHDFVEAAFMRRAGYEVRQLPELIGSWEEMPANLIDYAARERRWTQGNLQHARLLGFPGLHPLSRVHFLTGILSYVSSLMWLALLLVSSLVSAIETTKKPQYFLPGPHTLPQWPQMRAGETAVLFALTLAVLLLPKILGTLLTLRDRHLRRQFGGAARLCLSLLVEQFFSVLLAPSMMLFHSTFVAQTLLGKAVSWNPQDRSNRGVTLREAFRRQKWHLAFGLAWGAIMLRVAPHFFWWLTPVLVGLVCGVGLSAWTSRTSAGRIARRWGLLLIPEETAPPRELTALRDRRLAYSSGISGDPAAARRRPSAAARRASRFRDAWYRRA